VLFPSNTFPRGPPRRPPEPPAIVAAKQRCAETVLDVIPLAVRRAYLVAAETREEQLGVVEAWLDVLGDAYLNRHLVFAVLELCLVRVLPELADRGPKSMLEERLGGGL